jgi:hypothetical protein
MPQCTPTQYNKGKKKIPVITDKLSDHQRLLSGIKLGLKSSLIIISLHFLITHIRHQKHLT